ncbi:hypothetical protein HDG38_003224 [Paraburkholderia sp. WSM4177]|nr:hypothetical protein [Paraburkholderia sp. WSM4177]MBB5485419.1 hypothetical protein [Paraburkholderia sp. WSM4180]
MIELRGFFFAFAPGKPACRIPNRAIAEHPHTDQRRDQRERSRDEAPLPARNLHFQEAFHDDLPRHRAGECRALSRREQRDREQEGGEAGADDRR